MPNGRYIVIEGNDGTGKSTQVERLLHYYAGQGTEAVIVEEPGSDDPEKSTPVAQYLRSVIKNRTLARHAEINLALFSAARRELWQQKISPALGRGAVVLAARNYLSSLVYQGYGEGLDLDHIRDVTLQFTDQRYLSPDNTIILTMNDESERAARIAKRGKITHPDTFESLGEDFQQSVNNGYLALAHDLQFPTIPCINDGGRRKSIDEILREIIGIVDKA